MTQSVDYRHGDLICLSGCDNALMDSMEQPEEHRRAMGKRIEALRERAELSQTALAAAAGITQPSLWAIETGNTKEITARTLIGLCHALNTTVDHVWNGSAQSKSRAMEEAELVALFRRLPSNERMAILQTARTMRLAKASGAPAETEASDAELLGDQATQEAAAKTALRVVSRTRASSLAAKRKEKPKKKSTNGQ